MELDDASNLGKPFSKLQSHCFAAGFYTDAGASHSFNQSCNNWLVLLKKVFGEVSPGFPAG